MNALSASLGLGRIADGEPPPMGMARSGSVVVGQTEEEPPMSPSGGRESVMSSQTEADEADERERELAEYAMLAA